MISHRLLVRTGCQIGPPRNELRFDRLRVKFRPMNRRQLVPLVLAAATLTLPACISIDMLARAEGEIPPTQANNPAALPYPRQPAYYLLVPLTIPLDIITFPAQYIYFNTGDRRAR